MKKKIKITEIEKNQFLRFRHLTTVADVFQAVVKNEELNDFISRNFSTNFGELMGWLESISSIRRIVHCSGTYSSSIEMVYELDDDENIEDIDWENEAQRHIDTEGGDSGYESFTEEHISEIEEEITFNWSDVQIIELKKKKAA